MIGGLLVQKNDMLYQFIGFRILLQLHHIGSVDLKNGYIAYSNKFKPDRYLLKKTVQIGYNLQWLIDPFYNFLTFVTFPDHYNKSADQLPGFIGQLAGF